MAGQQIQESKLDKVIDKIKLLSQLRIEPFLFLFVFGVSVRDVTFQSVLMNRACLLRLNETEEICSNLHNHTDIKNTVQQITLHYRIGIMLVACIPAAISATFLSPWSDKYGRRPVMMAAVLGAIIEGVGTTVFTAISSAPTYLFLLTHIPSGFFGGYLMVVSSTYTYLSDVTKPESRAIRFGILEALFIVASPLGTEIGGQIYKYSGAVPVLATSVVVYAAAFLWATFAVKETRGIKEKKECKEMARYLFTLKNLKETVGTCIAERPGTIRAQIVLLILAASIGVFFLMGTVAIGFLFANLMYDWTNPQYSTVTAIARFIQGLVVMISVVIFTKVLNMPDTAIAIIGVLSAIAECAIKTVAYRPWMFYYASVAGLLAGVLGVAIRSRLSKLVTQQELSKVFAFLALCEALTPPLGFVIFGSLYSASLKDFPGASYLLMTFMFTIALGIFIWIKKQGPPPTSHELNEGGYRMESFAE